MRLDELAALIYEHSCQLAKVKHQVETSDLCTSGTRRTNTDG